MMAGCDSVRLDHGEAGKSPPLYCAIVGDANALIASPKPIENAKALRTDFRLMLCRMRFLVVCKSNVDDISNSETLRGTLHSDSKQQPLHSVF